MTGLATKANPPNADDVVGHGLSGTALRHLQHKERVGLTAFELAQVFVVQTEQLRELSGD